MSKLNNFAKDLFINLIENGDKYIKNCSSYGIHYIVNNKQYWICYKADKFKEAEPIKLSENNNLINFVGYFNPCVNTNKINKSIIFTVTVNDRIYDVPEFDRVTTAMYLDKLDNIMACWEENQLINAINDTKIEEDLI